MIGHTQHHPEWRVIVEALCRREYGDIVSHEEMERIGSLHYPSHRYFSQVAKARKALLKDWQREIETLPKIGYRLVNPDEFHRRSRREVSLAGRKIRRGVQILVAAPQDRLSTADNARNADSLAKLGALESHRRKVMIGTRPSLPAPPRHHVPKMNAH